MTISQATLDEIARISREYPDGVHTCAELQRMEPGRRPCTCGRCSQVTLKVFAYGGRDELSQAIPPAYTEYIGRQLLEHIRGEVAAQA